MRTHRYWLPYLFSDRGSYSLSLLAKIDRHIFCSRSIVNLSCYLRNILISIWYLSCFASIGVHIFQLLSPYHWINLIVLYEYQEALKALWHAAFPNVALNGLISEQWKEMGWQGPNPSTDFRYSFVQFVNYSMSHNLHEHWKSLIKRKSLGKKKKQFESSRHLIL